MTQEQKDAVKILNHYQTLGRELTEEEAKEMERARKVVRTRPKNRPKS